MPCFFRIQLASSNGRGLAGLCLRKPVRPVLNKLEDTERTALNKRPVQRGESLLVGSLNTGAPS